MNTTTAKSANLGFPRLGIKREWKKALEDFWAGKITEKELLGVKEQLQEKHWHQQIEAGIGLIPVGDFAFYDHMLDMTALLGAVPPRYNIDSGAEIDLKTYFAMARGRQDANSDVTAMEMTKWFDTNYHYIVPEFYRSTQFRRGWNVPFDALKSARQAGVQNPRMVLIGPVTFLLLGKIMDDGLQRRDLLPGLLLAYRQLLEDFADAGIEWVQIDEPVLVTDLTPEAQELIKQAYNHLYRLSKRPKILLASYFGGLEDNAGLALSLGAEAIHLDLVRAPEQLPEILNLIDDKTILSLGVIDGRNIWRADLHQAFILLQTAAEKIGKNRIQVAPSCSLLHSPIDLNYEKSLPPEIKEWMAFALQKLDEVSLLTDALNNGIDQTIPVFQSAREALIRRQTSPLVVNPQIRAKTISKSMAARPSAFPVRKQVQQQRLQLPALPSTTIGSFPQTKELRKIRADFKKGEISSQDYKIALKNAIKQVIRLQEEIGLDVLVHGEFERNDMVEYFGEQLQGFIFTQNGWVQSYGSRAVKPPIIYGDILRQTPMTVEWSAFAQSLTDKPVKGMLTGPVTMLKWSFVRSDQPLSETCMQLAAALREETIDLEKAGIKVIQIDEPALREGLPLRKKYWKEYLEWAVKAFRIASSGVKDHTQIHTHMCYSEFNEIIESIAALDADVISIEASRSKMELLQSFREFQYPNQIGPGLYDIHSPRVPSAEEIASLLKLALRWIPSEQLWCNPDCGLKTRAWKETKEALTNMISAVKLVRSEIA